ncbi:conserved hypothetical protein [Culex quinquefasciatus]|uniref:Ig-like domain-containing protein n=1 Tax=Culex quinquefasciatus TaxID=7176 RepID=B0XDT2_CULQU|nr:conserved hypothetical protein [Culex quinquefasciatus]|eukprot:XP_001867804.1 conserved hypothetical protein [Culex quinquefasciatus]
MYYVQCHQVVALQLTEINVPDIVDYRHPVTMSCSYDLGENQLNSVKWYKGNEEFYRFAPMLNPRFKDFPVEGVQVVTPESLCNQFLCQIWLTNLSRHSSGQYRCEVSGDAPQFALANGSKNMTVEALPQHDPIISGHMVTYSPGDSSYIQTAKIRLKFCTQQEKLDTNNNTAQTTSGLALLFNYDDDGSTWQMLMACCLSCDAWPG